MLRLATTTILALVLAACGIMPVSDGPPVAAGPLGPIVESPDGGPPVECRGVPISICQSYATDDPDIVRTIVTCTSVCTPQRGEVRIDILGADGRVRSAGNGAYESAEAAPEPVPAPLPSDVAPS